MWGVIGCCHISDYAVTGARIYAIPNIAASPTTLET